MIFDPVFLDFFFGLIISQTIFRFLVDDFDCSSTRPDCAVEGDRVVEHPPANTRNGNKIINTLAGTIQCDYYKLQIIGASMV
jgi:hypothetical protein